MSEFRSVQGKVAIITGSAGGLGKGMAIQLAEEGVTVVLADISPKVEEAFQDVLEKAPENKGFARIVDVSKETEVENLVNDVVQKFGKLDIMVNNAGIAHNDITVMETSEELIDKIMAVNFKGIFFGCKHAGNQMMQQKSGTIVNTGSFFGKVGHETAALYGASKGAVHTLTQSLSLELARYNVNVNALCPGLGGTDMHWGFVEREAQAKGVTFEEIKQQELDSIPLGRFGYGHDFAGAIMWLASQSGSYVTGQLININGGLDFS